MQDMVDIAWLRQYTEENSEETFAALVTRHINKVYSCQVRLQFPPNRTIL